MKVRLQPVLLILLAMMVFSVPNSLGMQRDDKKPLLVVIYADWCPLCQKLKPILARINEEYQGQIRFVRLDVTSQATMSTSREEARNLGLEPFFNENQQKTSLVVIQDPSGHEVFRAIHDYNFHHYASVLDRQLQAQSK